MGIKDVLSKFKNILGNNENDGLPDDVTRDKVLRGLRRQRRVQMEEVEKERLRNDIASFNKKRMGREVFGIKNNAAPIPKTFKQPQKVVHGMMKKMDSQPSMFFEQKGRPKRKNSTSEGGFLR